MIALHADDAMGKAAQAAAVLASRMDLRLLGAASANLTREQRSASLIRAFAQWPKICRAMAELERVAPSASAAGAEEDARARDFVEGRRV